jgi:hypothetical protein
MWRSRVTNSSKEKEDELIRFMLYDTDFSLGTHFDYMHYPQLFSDLKSSVSLRYLLESPYMKELLKARASEIVELLSSQDCLTIVTAYFDKVEPLIQQNNIRYYGTVGTGYINKWNTLIEYLENRGTYFLSFINEL